MSEKKEMPMNPNASRQTAGLSTKSTFIEIDYIKLLWTFLANWLIIVLCLVAGCGAGFAYSRFFVKKQYQADASFFIADTTNSISISDVTFGSSLAGDYYMVLNSRDTMKAIIRDLGMDITYRELRNMINVTRSDDKDTHIMTVTATAADPQTAIAIANATVNVGKQRIFEVIAGSEITTMELATPDSVTEVTPSMWKYIRYGALIGLIAPLAVIFLMVALDNTLSDEEEINKKLKLPIVGNIPYYGDKNIMTDKLSFFEREAFNTLCGNIELSGYGIKTVAITSSTPNEGKSSISYKVAEVLTEFGKKVCYVDCDMRNSNFCENFGIDKSKVQGLSEYLSRNIELKSVIYKTNNAKLSVIIPGKYPPNPSALLSSERFKTLITQLNEDFDYIIMDTPPISAVIDGVFIAKECDGCIIIVEEGVTDTKRAIKTRDALSEADVNILGVVVNKINRKGKSYGYGKYGRYGKYGKYGKRYGYGYGYGYGKGYGHTPEDNEEHNNQTELQAVTGADDK